jgi:GNAT superfamily N-acetyltransferase
VLLYSHRSPLLQMTYRLRKADWDDGDEEVCRELNAKCFTAGEHVPVFSTGYWWVLYNDFDPVGFCGLEIQTDIVYGNKLGYLCRAGVREDHRGRGLQLRMIRVRERKARELGCTEMLSDTCDNPPSANSLIRAGYKMFVPTHPWALKDSLYWKRSLQ